MHISRRSISPAAVAAAAFVLLVASPAAPAAAPAPAIDPSRIAQIAAMLGPAPSALGPSVTNRVAWQAVAALPAFQGVVRDAEKRLREPLPDQPDDLFLEFSRTGNRTRWQSVAGRRRGRIALFTLAEAIDHRGRFVAGLSNTVAALCAEKTWVMPAHDRNLENFNGKNIDLDLGSTMLAWELATCDRVLGDRLDADTRRLIQEEVRRRVLTPYHEVVEGQRRGCGWIRATHNWNAVCHGGVAGAALALLPAREDRAFFVAAAEANLKYFLSGFTSDGYCSEGMGYWNYGFGHFVLLAEQVRQATGGKLDWMASPTVQPVAAFGRRMEIVNDVFPAFADCSVSARPAGPMSAWLDRCFPSGDAPADVRATASPRGNLYEALMYAFAPDRPAVGKKVRLDPSPLRSWFDQAGILICRMPGGATARFGAAMKGGHNAEHHNHNDVGSYVVVVGKVPVLLDPGAEEYTARTFSSRRYESKVLNSFGHPVPVVAGCLQSPGAECRGKVLESTLLDTLDTLKLDLASCYPDAKGLKSLTRTFAFSREGEGALRVRDEFEFDGPKEFGSALITQGKWRRDGSALVIEYGGEAVRVEITSDGAGFTIADEKIEEDVHLRDKPLRIGINLEKPVEKGRIAFRITPMPRGAGGAE